MTDRASLRRGMAGCSHVFHVAAYARNWAADPQVFTAQNVEGVRNVLAVARESGADAIHPGDGFLAENPEFAEACADAGITFMGPPASAMRMMGDKVTARAAMQAGGVPVLPGTGAFRGGPDEAAAIAADIGYPVILKAAAGGGGKGMRLVLEPGELQRALDSEI